MTKGILKILSITTLVSLTACTSHPTFQEVMSADYGPFPENYESLVKDFYSQALKDPSSVVYQKITEPETRYFGNKMGERDFGWLVCARRNAKNSFGAYTGFSNDGFLIKNGRITKYLKGGEWWVTDVCTEIIHR